MVSILIKGLITVGTKLLLSMGSEAMVKWVFFKVAQTVVDTSKTNHDNQFLDELKKSYENTPDKV